MVQKVIDVVGLSSESFAKAAAGAVATAAKSVRNMRWARVSELELAIEDDRVTEYRTTLHIYFDIE